MRPSRRRAPAPPLARSRTRARRAAVRSGTSGSTAGPRTLRELRTDAAKTQLELATATGISQIEVSRAERRRDHKVSTLRRYVKALGGDLVVFAQFGRRLIPLRDI